MARKSKYYQRPDGLYEAIRTINGKRVAFRGKSCREVDRKILEFTGLEQRGRLFADVADEWWERHVEEISPNTVRNYSSALSRAVERFGNCSMKEIHAKTVRSLPAHAGGSEIRFQNHRGAKTCFEPDIPSCRDLRRHPDKR